MKWLAVLGLLCFMAGPAFAEPDDLQELSPMFKEVARHWEIPETWAVAIAKTESGLKPWALNIEGQGYFFASKDEAMEAAAAALETGRSFDVGLMQVNSFWLKKYGIPLDAAFDQLANIYLGGFILKKEVERHGLTSEAIGAYHSPTEDKARAYADKVLKLLDETGVQPVVKPVKGVNLPMKIN